MTPTSRPRSCPSVAAVLLVLTAGCGPQAPALPVVPATTILQPTRGIHLRAAFDDDPTAYVGRFVPDALPADQIDETASLQTRCSEYFVHKVVNSSQELDEIAYTSTKVGGSIGYKPVAAVSASVERGARVRIKYTLTRRMQVTVKDPAALQRCCAASPDQCTGQVIGEFLMGSGEVYQAADSQIQGEASTVATQVTGAIDYKDGVGWKRVNSFKDMYFAFLTTATIGAPSPSDERCGWCDSIPPSPDGVYFCGMSPPVAAEAMARDLAMQNAREQVVKYVGEYLSTQSTSEASLVKGYLDDKRVTTAAASGIAARVKDTKWCKATTTNTPEGPLYSVKVLAYLDNADRRPAAQSVIDTLLATGANEEKGAAARAGQDALQKLKDKVK